MSLAAGAELHNDSLGYKLSIVADRPVGVWAHPLETVSNSEGGFELNFQGVVVLAVFAPHLLESGVTFQVGVE